jgi:cysteine synthase A
MRPYGILSTIGNTPTIPLARLFGDERFRVFAKWEGSNAGGSAKDRPALAMICDGLASGAITRDTIIIESSSGNMGIGLAQACAYFGLQFICVVDSKITRQNLRILRAYGATVDVVRDPAPQTGGLLQARLNRVRELCELHPNIYWVNQYANPANALAHHQTMAELVRALGNDIDYVFVATSTCGTLRGCAEYIREHGLRARVIAVDARGSVIFGSDGTKRLLPGHGASRVPELHCPELVTDHVHISDLECIVGCRRLVRTEAILAGASSGAVVTAVRAWRERIVPGATCAVILPDRGERYLDTVYSDAWVRHHFGDVAHLWEEDETAAQVLQESA